MLEKLASGAVVLDRLKVLVAVQTDSAVLLRFTAGDMIEDVGALADVRKPIAESMMASQPLASFNRQHAIALEEREGRHHFLFTGGLTAS